MQYEKDYGSPGEQSLGGLKWEPCPSECQPEGDAQSDTNWNDLDLWSWPTAAYSDLPSALHSYLPGYSLVFAHPLVTRNTSI